ncbi:MULTISPECIES: hypothetical protein [unclassified Paenibacillus]|uniref:hypothetical protein n=1 Tax=unclassified Paenibacillus TaxID=185978 RepID=UPI001AE7E570|nr:MULTISPECIES: hypothetical protein [unclassified Paenibacillus]MBP1153290.1 hypothetical protein [Paenibacillus sp. PvP091]MBP1171327.1 hypothetical protein [Paenibacillus sp. PvR098]MBP2442355.1 hypothetical protein [Paenibacillus sp. PvP052]
MTSNRIHSHLEEIALIGKLADLKEDHYQHSLLLSAVIELLMEKGMLTAEELSVKTQALEVQDEAAVMSDLFHE